MKHFYLYIDRVEIILADDNKLVIYFNTNSGRIFYRYKINTISHVRHPGIYLGIDCNRNHWYIHNHFEHSRPVIEIEKDFVKGQSLYAAERQSQFGYWIVIQNALNEASQSRSYDWISYNCQTFVNRVCFSEHTSEAVEYCKGGVLAGLLLVAGIGVFTNSK